MQDVEAMRISHLSGPVKTQPPYRAIPFRYSITEGVSHAFCFVFMWFAQASLKYPPSRGVWHLKCACQDWRRGIQSLHVETHKTP